MDKGKKKTILLICVLALANIVLISLTLNADEMSFKFKNPSFSGQGT